MRRTFLQFSALFLLLAVLPDVRCTIRSTRHLSKSVRVRREGETAPQVRIIKTGTLKDGTKFEKIEELAKELPPLPVEEEVEDLSDDRIGHIDNNGELLVPIDENGKVLPGFEHLLQPIVIEISEEQSQKLRNELGGDSIQNIMKEVERKAELATDEGQTVGGFVWKNQTAINQEAAKIIEAEHPQDRATFSERYEEVAGDDYEEPKQETQEQPAPLPPVDYSDSGESDEDLTTSDDGNNGEKEIDVPKNNLDGKTDQSVEEESEAKTGDRIDVESGGETDEKNAEAETILRPDQGELGDPVPFVPVPDKIEKQDENLDAELSDDVIRSLAQEFSKDVFGKIFSKAGEISGLEDDSDASQTGSDGSDASADKVDANEIFIGKNADAGSDDDVAEGRESDDGKSRGRLDGYELEVPFMTAEERERIRLESEGKIPAQEPTQPTVVVRGGRIGADRPDGVGQLSVPIFTILAAFVLTLISF